MVTLGEFLKSEMSTETINEYALCDGATNWYMESLYDHLSESNSDELDEVVIVSNNTVHSEQYNLMYILIPGHWDENGEFVRA